MGMRCANHCCNAVRQSDEGKLYRLDLELGSLRGEDEHRTEYLWLCSECASYLRLRVQAHGDSVQVRLSARDSAPPRIPPQIDRAAGMRLHIH
jgi:hypothetical protein